MGRISVAVATLAFFFCAASFADNITLNLGPPQNCECGWVSINGGVSSDHTIQGLTWDWGDGSRTMSFFPATHRYAANGSYTVTVTAVGCTTLAQSTSVQVTNATGPGCPTDASPACNSYPCRYLSPANMHLTSGGNGGPLMITDPAGSPVTGTTSFTPDKPDLVSVAGNGTVTALRTEGTTEIGTWISSTIDGRQTANSCVARVLPSNYGVSFLQSVGDRTALYYPAAIGGLNIDDLVQQYEIPTVNEYAYAIESELMESAPFQGCRQIFEVDFGAGEGRRVCGISGNPIRLGWNITGNAFQNCFLVPFFGPRSPQWGIFYHELGHNFLGSSLTFNQALGIQAYVEGLATIMGLATQNRVLRNPARYPMGIDAEFSVQYLYDRDTTFFLTAYQNWLNAGAPFFSVNPDIVDGIWLHHAGVDVGRFASRFFLPLQPGYLDAMGGSLCGITSDASRHTFFAALVSAAAGQDLSALFAGTYHYPIDQPLFDTVYAACTTLLGQTAAGPVPGQGSNPASMLTVSRDAGGNITLAWGASCHPTDSDYAIYEGALGQFYSHTPRFCTTAEATTKTFAPSPGGTYYLVVPLSPSREGSYGEASSSLERPQGAAVCAPQTIHVCM